MAKRSGGAKRGRARRWAAAAHAACGEYRAAIEGGRVETLLRSYLAAAGGREEARYLVFLSSGVRGPSLLDADATCLVARARLPYHAPLELAPAALARLVWAEQQEAPAGSASTVRGRLAQSHAGLAAWRRHLGDTAEGAATAVTCALLTPDAVHMEKARAAQLRPRHERAGAFQLRPLGRPGRAATWRDRFDRRVPGLLARHLG
jgi:hypothetical protein